MPDVIIKGMEMPSGCRTCKLNNDTICALINGCVYDETDGSTRRPDCPLRPALEREQPITSNADRIRAMSDEELMGYMYHNCHCPPELDELPSCPYRKKNRVQTKDCRTCWLDWLQSPAGGDGNG